MTKKRLLISFFLTLLLLIGGLVGYLLLFSDSWKGLAVEAIQERITTEMTVGDVDVDLFASFPQVSVVLHDINIKGAVKREGDQPSSMVMASEFGVSFSVWDVLFGEPVIRSAYLNSGEIIAEEYSNGKWNLEVVEFDKGDGGEGESKFKITNFYCNDIDFTYIERGEVKSRGIVTSGNASSETVKLTFEDLVYGDLNEVFEPFYGEFTAVYSADEKGRVTVNIEGGLLNDVGVTTEVVIDEGNVNAKGHFHSVSQDDLKRVFIAKEDFQGWSYDKRVNVFFNTGGSNGVVEFAAPEGQFAVGPSLTGLRVNNKGEISGGVRLELDYERDMVAVKLSDVKVRSNGVEARIEGRTSRFREVPFEGTVEGALDLSRSYDSWLPGLEASTQSILPNKGELKFSSDFEGEQMMLESSYMEGELDSRPYQLSNVRVKFAGGKMNVESLSYDWVGNVGNVVANVEAYEKAMDGGAVKGSVDVVAESVVVDPILVWWENRPDDGEGASDYAFLPHGSDFNFSINTDKLYWEQLECTEASTRGDIGANKLRLGFAKLNTLEGELVFQGSARPTNENIVLGISGGAENISLKEMFRVYENFGQTVLRAEHMTGRGDVTGSMNLVWAKDGSWKSDAFDADLDVSISNGRLKNLEVFDEVADYLKEHRLIAPLVDPEDLRKRLSDIDFESVESPITVSASTVTVPFLKIHSSAMDVSLEGSQTFAGGIDYTLGFALRDLKDNGQGEFGKIEDDGLGNMFFLGMNGTLEMPKYSYDREAHRAHRRRGLNAEAERIRDAIRGDGDEPEEKPEEIKEGEAPDETKPVRTRMRTNSPNNLNDPDDDDF